MSSPPKNYKIIVGSKHFRNMKGICPAEVAKKAASKILSLSNNRITQFSIIETKNGKILNYKAFKENLIRPYKKNGKLIKCRIIVKKLVKHTGGGDIRELLVKSKRKFTKKEIKRIKDEMFVYNWVLYDDEGENEDENDGENEDEGENDGENEDEGKNEDNKLKYEPYNLTETNRRLIVEGNKRECRSIEFLELGKNDPILYFFPKEVFNIGFILRDDEGTLGHMTLSYKNPDDFDYKNCKIFYEFTGDKDSFVLHIYNLNSCFRKLTKTDAAWLLEKWESYISFLKKLYPSTDISFNFYSDVPSPKNRNKRRSILRVPIFLNRNNHNSFNVGLDFYSQFKNDLNESNQNTDN
jgi:hypothetical protein